MEYNNSKYMAHICHHKSHITPKFSQFHIPKYIKPCITIPYPTLSTTPPTITIQRFHMKAFTNNGYPAYIKPRDHYSTFKRSSNYNYASKYASFGGKPYIPKPMTTLESCRHVLGGQGALRSCQTEH